MRRFILLGCAAFALIISVSSVQAQPPLDAEAAKEQRLHKFMQDYSDALRRYAEAVKWNAEAQAAVHPEDGPCRH